MRDRHYLNVMSVFFISSDFYGVQLNPFKSDSHYHELKRTTSNFFVGITKEVQPSKINPKENEL